MHKLVFTKLMAFFLKSLRNWQNKKKAENLAKKSENLAKKFENLAKKSENLAKMFENLAKESENLAKKSENLAKKSENLTSGFVVHIIQSWTLISYFVAKVI